MNAAVCTRYGSPEVLEIRDVNDPVPGDNDLLIKVHAAAVTSGDARIRAMRMPSPTFWLLGRLALGLTAPRQQILGSDLAGTVTAVGHKVTSFAVGDPVIAALGARFGAHAQLARIPESGAVVHKPPSLTFEEAAALPFGAITALHYLRNFGDVRPGHKVLIIGASGCVGSAAVQIARHLGATVTGVCSTANIDRVRALGANDIIDYTKDDFTTRTNTYDIIFDTVGATTFARCKSALTSHARFLPAVLTMTEFRQLLWTSLTGGKRLKGGVVLDSKQQLMEILQLVEAGHLQPVIDRQFHFHDIAEAHRRVDSGRKVGAVVVTMTTPSSHQRHAP